MDYRSAGLLEAGRVGFLSCIAVRAEAIRQAGGFDERLGAIEDSDLFRRLATLGPFATVRRRTVLARPPRDRFAIAPPPRVAT